MGINRRQESDELEPKLRVSVEAARVAIDARLTLGNPLLEIQITSETNLAAARAAYETWHENNYTELEGLFTDDKMARRIISMDAGNLASLDVTSEARDLKVRIRREIKELESIRDQLGRNGESE